MKTYTVNDVRKSIRKVGIKKDDAVFIYPETYKFGILENIQCNNKLYEIFFKVISEIIGPKGTICIQSYTFNTLRFNKIFYYDKPESTSGGFSNYILSLKKQSEVITQRFQLHQLDINQNLYLRIILFIIMGTIHH